MQNIHPLGIKTRLLPLLVLRFTVFPFCPFTASLSGKVTSKPYRPFFVLSSVEEKVGVDIATKHEMHQVCKKRTNEIIILQSTYRLIDCYFSWFGHLSQKLL